MQRTLSLREEHTQAGRIIPLRLSLEQG